MAVSCIRYSGVMEPSSRSETNFAIIRQKLEYAKQVADYLSAELTNCSKMHEMDKKFTHIDIEGLVLANESKGNKHLMDKQRRQQWLHFLYYSSEPMASMMKVVSFSTTRCSNLAEGLLVLTRKREDDAFWPAIVKKTDDQPGFTFAYIHKVGVFESSNDSQFIVIDSSDDLMSCQKSLAAYSARHPARAESKYYAETTCGDRRHVDEWLSALHAANSLLDCTLADRIEMTKSNFNL